MATEILSGLWLSNEETALNETFLNAKRIKIIINISEDIPFANSNRYVCHRVKVNDNPEYTSAEDNCLMYNSLDKMTKYMHKCLLKNFNILVHCHAGKQRSPTLVAAYLIRYGNLKMQSAINYIRSKREICFHPHANFSDALRQYEKDLV